MSTLAYIDRYFTGEMPPDEIVTFEQQIARDSSFAEEVAFYCHTMQVAREKVVAEKKKRFRELYQAAYPGQTHRQRVAGMRKWIPYVAAAAVLAALVIGWQLLLPPAPSALPVDAYISDHFSAMSVKMNAAEDSLDTAKRLFNENKLQASEEWFEQLAQSGTATDEAVRDAGIVSLRLGDYDKAIAWFTTLENLQLYANPGKFYHALTLLKRNHSGDRQAAKQLLQQVVEHGLEEKETAAKWLQYL